jgi:hypothetical protein
LVASADHVAFLKKNAPYSVADADLAEMETRIHAALGLASIINSKLEFAERDKAEEADDHEWEGLETTRTEGELGWATFEHIYAHLSANLPEGLTLRRDENGVGWAEATGGSTPGMLAFAFWVRPVEEDAEHGPYYSTVHLACRVPMVWYYDAGYDPTREGGATGDYADVYAHMAELARIALS